MVVTFLVVHHTMGSAEIVVSQSYQVSCLNCDYHQYTILQFCNLFFLLNSGNYIYPY